jgi:cysteine desulfurase
VTVGIPPPEAYLDHAASTPARAEVVEAMIPWLGEQWGNPTGAHARGRAARRAVDEAREPVAELLGCAGGEVVFTSGGTEADDLAVNGVLDAVGGMALCSAVEHHAVLDPVLHAGGATVPVDARGVLDCQALAAMLDTAGATAAAGDGPGVTLVSVMLANNEVGTIQPLAHIAEVVARHAPGAVMHTDAVQAAAWCDVASMAAGIPLVSLSGHKIGGPKGVGALAVRPGVALAPRLRGGGQERGRRSGTHNVAGIVGLGVAARLVLEQRSQLAASVGALRDRLEDALTDLDGVSVTVAPNGVAPPERLPTICHLCVSGVDSEALLFLLDDAGVAASAASSCASGATESSHVLAAMGVSATDARGSLRLSLGWTTDDATVDRVIEVMPAAVARLRLFDVSSTDRS